MSVIWRKFLGSLESIAIASIPNEPTFQMRQLRSRWNTTFTWNLLEWTNFIIYLSLNFYFIFTMCTCWCGCVHICLWVQVHTHLPVHVSTGQRCTIGCLTSLILTIVNLKTDDLSRLSWEWHSGTCLTPCHAHPSAVVTGRCYWCWLLRRFWGPTCHAWQHQQQLLSICSA